VLKYNKILSFSFAFCLAFLLCLNLNASEGKCTSCQKNCNSNETAEVSGLVIKWVTEGLSTPESVIYDLKNDVLYVSNVNGVPNEKDGNGFISKISKDGKILELKWVEGLDAPKGMTIEEGKLYVSDINQLAEIDIASGKVLKKYLEPNAVFLNDVTSDESGNVLVSDMMDNKIYTIENGNLIVWLDDKALQAPNGLLAYGDKLIVASWGDRTEGFETTGPGHLKIVSLKTKEIKSLGNGTPIGHLDGLESDGRGRFLATDWKAGKLFHIMPCGKAFTLLDLNSGSADLEHADELDLIIIPMMNDNKITAYEFK
jgi:hypothetical protein